MIQAEETRRAAPAGAAAPRPRIVEYAPEHFEALREAAASTPQSASLTHRPFVDYYYASAERCRLYLFLDAEGAVAGTLGVERVGFEHEGRPLALSFGSNFFAFRKGAAGLLFMHWMKTYPAGVVFGGSPDTHHITRSQKWAYYGGVKTYLLNRAYQPHAGDSPLRALAKWGARSLGRRVALGRLARRVPPEFAGRLSVREEASATGEMLPRRSAFSLRMAEGADYLNWRYNTRLPFVRYRVFRVLDRNETSGYVIINESPSRLIVSQCDGEQAEALAHAVVLALAEASRGDRRPREVMLTSSHDAMRRAFEAYGFRAAPQERPFAVGSRRGGVELGEDTSGWLVNFDWTDNGLRPPFLDQGRGGRAG